MQDAGQIARQSNDLLSSSLSNTNSAIKNKKKNREIADGRLINKEHFNPFEGFVHVNRSTHNILVELSYF